MIIGSEAVIISVDEAQVLLNALHIDWTREKIRELQKEGSYAVIDNLRTAVRHANKEGSVI